MQEVASVYTMADVPSTATTLSVAPPCETSNVALAPNSASPPEATASTSSRGPFLDLPVELRLRVYDFLTPLHTSSADVHGLYLTCKTIQAEFGREHVAKITKVFNAVNASWPTPGALRTGGGVPTRTADLHSLQVDIPMPSTDEFLNGTVSSLLMPLFNLRLERLSLQFLVIPSSPDMMDQFDAMFDWQETDIPKHVRTDFGVV